MKTTIKETFFSEDDVIFSIQKNVVENSNFLNEFFDLIDRKVWKSPYPRMSDLRQCGFWKRNICSTGKETYQDLITDNIFLAT